MSNRYIFNNFFWFLLLLLLMWYFQSILQYNNNLLIRFEVINYGDKAFSLIYQLVRIAFSIHQRPWQRDVWVRYRPWVNKNHKCSYTCSKLCLLLHASPMSYKLIENRRLTAVIQAIFTISQHKNHWLTAVNLPVNRTARSVGLESTGSLSG